MIEKNFGKQFFFFVSVKLRRVPLEKKKTHSEIQEKGKATKYYVFCSSTGERRRRRGFLFDVVSSLILVRLNGGDVM